MSDFLENTKIDIAAATNVFKRLMRDMSEHFKQIAEISQTWLPYVFRVRRAEVSRVHKLYRRKQLARRKRNRRK